MKCFTLLISCEEALLRYVTIILYISKKRFVSYFSLPENRLGSSVEINYKVFISFQLSELHLS